MRMHNPPHPGEIIREFCIEPLNINVTEAAKALGVTRKTFSALLNGRSGISPEMALKLSKVFVGLRRGGFGSNSNTICGKQNNMLISKI
jgi:addiction module HigA family antidote